MGKPKQEHTAEFMDVDESAAPTKAVVRSKNAKKNLRKKENKKLKEEEKANRPKKPEQEPRLPSSVILPEHSALSHSIEDDEALFAEIQKRLYEHNAMTVRVSPVPKACPPSLLQDLCPTAIAVRFPSKNNCRYAFLDFRSTAEAQAALKSLNGKQLDGKTLKAENCGIVRKPTAGSSGTTTWKPAADRTLDDFDMTNLYVSRLPRFTERTDLAQVFRTAASIKFDQLPDGTCKGSCQLKFRTREKAKKVFSSLHGTMFKGIPIMVNYAIKRSGKQRSKPAPALIKQEVTGTKKPINLKKRKAVNDEDDKQTSAGPVKRPHLETISQPAPQQKQQTTATAVPSKQGKSKKKNKSKKGKGDGDASTGEFSIKKQDGKKKNQLPKMQPYQLTRKSDKKPKVAISKK